MNRADRKHRRYNRRIRRELEHLQQTDINQFDYTQIDDLDNYLEAVNKIGHEIVAKSGSAGYYPVINRIHKDTVRRRRLLLEVKEVLAWE